MYLIAALWSCKRCELPVFRRGANFRMSTASGSCMLHFWRAQKSRGVRVTLRRAPGQNPLRRNPRSKHLPDVQQDFLFLLPSPTSSGPQIIYMERRAILANFRRRQWHVGGRAGVPITLECGRWDAWRALEMDELDQ